MVKANKFLLMYTQKKTHNYRGGFKNGQEDGFGVSTNYNGSIYTGNFSEGNYDGKGVIKYADGSTLEGKWDAGYIEGKAKLTSAKGYVMQYVNEFEKKYNSYKIKNKKYFSSDGKEITEQEYNANK